MKIPELNMFIAFFFSYFFSYFSIFFSKFLSLSFYANKFRWFFIIFTLDEYNISDALRSLVSVKTSFIIFPLSIFIFLNVDELSFITITVKLGLDCLLFFFSRNF